MKAGNVDAAGGGAPPYSSPLLFPGAMIVGSSVGMLMTGEPVKTGNCVKEGLSDDEDAFVEEAAGALCCGLPEMSTTGLPVKTGNPVKVAERLGPTEVGRVKVGNASVWLEGIPVPIVPVPLPEAPGGKTPPPTLVTVL